MNFLLDVCKYNILRNFKYVNIPDTYKSELDSYDECEYAIVKKLLTDVIKLNADIKWETSPKYMIEAVLVLEVYDGRGN